jgi:hypothetical protein
MKTKGVQSHRKRAAAFAAALTETVFAKVEGKGRQRLFLTRTRFAMMAEDLYARGYLQCHADRVALEDAEAQRREEEHHA